MADMKPYSARRQTTSAPWPLDELVRAQRMACEGHSFDAIAQALGRSGEDVIRKLDPPPAPNRPEIAGVGYQHIKRR
jgi:hypothetical protein